MEKTQWYLGVPNGVVLCVDTLSENKEPIGRLYHAYNRERMCFSNMDEILFYMEQLYDELRFPYPSTNTRSFLAEPSPKSLGLERIKRMRDEELLSQHGDLGSFIIRVQHRQNSSWQGRITWMEQDKTLYFRSIWEMIKLIASAIETSEAEQETSWFEEKKKQKKG